MVDILNVSTKTIRKYDAQGILHAERTAGNHRAIMRDELLRFLKDKGMLYDDSDKERRDIVYARVSSHDQKNHGDLDRLCFLWKTCLTPFISSPEGNGFSGWLIIK